MSAITALGYVGVHAPDLDDWAALGARVLGLQPVRPSRNDLAFRMDAAARRLLLSSRSEDPPLYLGWEVESAAALDFLAARLEAHQHRVRPLTEAEADRRGVRTGIATTDPLGNRLEFFLDQAAAGAPFTPGRAISGFRTGTIGMGHAVLTVARIDAVLPYYTNVLGFRLSDYTLAPFKAYFLHVNARHHSLALIESGQGGLHHLLLEVCEFDDLGQGYDLAQLELGRVATTLGRHANDHMVSFYVRTPSGFLIEYGWGGREIDPQTWHAREVMEGPSLWGHERDWLPDHMRAEARRLRLKAAAEGLKAPLRITRG